MVLLTHKLPLELKNPVPDALVDWVVCRDGFQCQAPGCGRVDSLEVHAIYPNSRGGHHNPNNLVTVCSVCRPLWDLMGRGPFVEARAEKALPVRSA